MSTTSSPKRSSSTWVLSLTTVCFLFGGLLAMQLRAFERVQETRVRNSQAQVQAQQQAEQSKLQAKKAEQATATMQKELAALRGRLADGTLVSKKQAQLLNTRIKELQLLAGLTRVSGPGIRVVMTDNPEAANAGGNSPFLPGVVHDFDLLQVVNELRSSNAEAIAINGTRVTGYTPIRCVGPTIRINWEAAAPPFVIEAIGNPDTLEAALKMPGGILQNLQNPDVGPALGIKLTRVDRLTLPAATGGAPRLKEAKAS